MNSGLLRRFAPRNDGALVIASAAKQRRSEDPRWQLRIQYLACAIGVKPGLLRRFPPRNDSAFVIASAAKARPVLSEVRLRLTVCHGLGCLAFAEAGNLNPIVTHSQEQFARTFIERFISPSSTVERSLESLFARKKHDVLPQRLLAL
jgi:hypothetical protein